MRVIRVLLYDGERKWVEQTLERSIPVDKPLTLPVGDVREVARVTLDDTE